MADLPASVVHRRIMDTRHGADMEFPIFTIFKNPADFPGKFVVRLFDCAEATVHCSVHDTLGGARDDVPEGYVCIPRSPSDDVAIFETWI